MGTAASPLRLAEHRVQGTEGVAWTTVGGAPAQRPLPRRPGAQALLATLGLALSWCKDPEVWCVRLGG